MPLLGFFDDGWTITQGDLSVVLAQPIQLTPTVSKRVDSYVFRDKTTASVDAGKDTDRLTITGLDMPNTTANAFPLVFPYTFTGMLSNQMGVLDLMTDAGIRVYINGLAPIDDLDTGYEGYYYITSLSYNRRPGPQNVVWYDLTLDSES